MKLTLERLREHHFEVQKGGIGKEKPNDVRETIEENLNEFTKQVYNTRAGRTQDRFGHPIPPRDVSLAEAVKYYFGCDFENFLKSLQIYKQSDNIASIARRFGLESLNSVAMENLLIEHSQFGNPMATPDISTDYRFIIPELFTNAIRVGYQHAALHNNWIASTQNLAQQKITMPLILRGDGMPSRVNEGADIPEGSIRFGKKEVSLFKVGTGFSITDELLLASTLDLLFIFLQEVGNDMAIGADSQAFLILVNGEQADSSESAAVIGTIDGSTFAYKDFKRVFTRMTRLGIPASRVIAGEDDGIDITSIAQFEGVQNGPNRLASIRSIIGVPETFDVDTYVAPSNQIMFLAPNRAMVKLQYRGMMTERRRNPKNQTEELYISDWINFAIVKRDARILLDKSISYSGNGFPTYMDIDTRINLSYNSI